MTEHSESAAEEPRRGSAAPGMEGEGGQFTDGDYGDAEATDGDPAEGAIREGLTDGQVQATPEERGPLHGDADTGR
ncbi:hypothetical protein [Arthrobacter sp. C152]